MCPVICLDFSTLATVAPPIIFMFRANFHLFECNKSFAYRTVVVITLVCTVINAMFSIALGGDGMKKWSYDTIPDNVEQCHWFKI